MEDKEKCNLDKSYCRKFLVIVDESPECENALAFAANRIQRTGGQVTLLFVAEPGDFQHWIGVKEIQREEAMNKAKVIFRLYNKKLKNWGCEAIQVEEIIREGETLGGILKLIQEDKDIAVLVLGASTDQSGPGPLVSALASGKYAGTFPIPISIVPGSLSIEKIKTLA
ncbi:MAG: universal stress protein [Pseudomonadota bacterium]